MSTSLCWHPLKDEYKTFSNDLKAALRALTKTDHINCYFGIDDLDFFNGLYLGGIDGAIEVINAIKQYGRIRIFERS